MLNISKLKIFLFLSLLLANIQISPKEYGVGQSILLSVGSLGIFPLYKLLAPYSDDEVYDLANEASEAILAEYEPQLQILKEIPQENKIIKKKNKTVKITTIKESAQQDLANFINREISVNNYINNLYNSIKELKSNLKSVEKRTKTILKKEPTSDLVKNMKNLTDDIKILIPQLQNLYEYIKKNEKYFSLNKLLTDLNIIYDNETRIIQAYEEPILTDEIKKAARAKSPGSVYPLLDYIDNLNKDIDDIEYKAKNLNHLPVILNSKLEQQKKTLYYIRDFIVGDYEYTEEKRKLNEEIKQKQLIDAINNGINSLLKNNDK